MHVKALELQSLSLGILFVDSFYWGCSLVFELESCGECSLVYGCSPWLHHGWCLVELCSLSKQGRRQWISLSTWMLWWHLCMFPCMCEHWHPCSRVCSGLVPLPLHQGYTLWSLCGDHVQWLTILNETSIWLLAIHSKRNIQTFIDHCKNDSPEHCSIIILGLGHFDINITAEKMASWKHEALGMPSGGTNQKRNGTIRGMMSWWIFRDTVWEQAL